MWCDVTVARQAVRNLQLSDETTQSLEASWELEDPHVESYRVTYAGLRGNHEEESVSSSSFLYFYLLRAFFFFYYML